MEGAHIARLTPRIIKFLWIGHIAPPIAVGESGRGGMFYLPVVITTYLSSLLLETGGGSSPKSDQVQAGSFS
jgi:hypothetical protein